MRGFFCTCNPNKESKKVGVKNFHIGWHARISERCLQASRGLVCWISLGGCDVGEEKCSCFVVLCFCCKLGGKISASMCQDSSKYFYILAKPSRFLVYLRD